MITNLRNYSDTESESKLEVKVDEDVKNAVEVYDGLVKHFNYRYSVFEPYLDKIDLVLNPLQITGVVDYLVKNYDSNTVCDKYSGYFISKLIQKSHNSGYNDFVINTHNIPIHYLGTSIEGMADNLLRLTINGDVGESLSCSTKYCHVEVFGKCEKETWSVPENTSFIFHDKESYNYYKEKYGHEYYKNTFKLIK